MQMSEKKETEGKAAPTETVRGIVTARKCDCCGHHEIGLTTADGRYIPLTPGMTVVIQQEAGD